MLAQLFTALYVLVIIFLALLVCGALEAWL